MTLFTIESREFGWDEVVIAAQMWGEWGRFIENVRESHSCFGLATRTGQLPPPSKVREVATAFRYSRNLISGEETRVWLQHWGMAVDDWMDCLRSQVLRQSWAGRLSEITRANPVSDEEVTAVAKNHAVCSDKLENWARRLAGHAAVAANSGQLLHGTESPRSLIELVETEFAKNRQQIMTRKLMENKIADHRLDWIHYDCRYLWFDDERIGREAAWCVNEDGLTLDQVALTARTEVKEWSFYADEIDARVRAVFLAAREGDLLGPLKLKSGYPLFSLINKTMPEIDDPKIVSRAENAIVGSLTAHAINERVKWVGV